MISRINLFFVLVLFLVCPFALAKDVSPENERYFVALMLESVETIVVDAQTVISVLKFNLVGPSQTTHDLYHTTIVPFNPQGPTEFFFVHLNQNATEAAQLAKQKGQTLQGVPLENQIRYNPKPPYRTPLTIPALKNQDETYLKLGSVILQPYKPQWGDYSDVTRKANNAMLAVIEALLNIFAVRNASDVLDSQNVYVYQAAKALELTDTLEAFRLSKKHGLSSVFWNKEWLKFQETYDDLSDPKDSFQWRYLWVGNPTRVMELVHKHPPDYMIMQGIPHPRLYQDILTRYQTLTEQERFRFLAGLVDSHALKDQYFEPFLKTELRWVQAKQAWNGLTKKMQQSLQLYEKRDQLGLSDLEKLAEFIKDHEFDYGLCQEMLYGMRLTIKADHISSYGLNHQVETQAGPYKIAFRFELNQEDLQRLEKGAQKPLQMEGVIKSVSAISSDKNERIVELDFPQVMFATQ